MAKFFDVVKRASLVLAAIVSFAAAVYLAIGDKVAAGTLMAGLFIVCVLLHYIPEMESIKAFSIEAKMRARLSEADELLKKLKTAALVSGKLTYHTLGWQSRMGHPVRIKQRLADEVDAYLKSMDIPDDDVRSIKQSYLDFLLFDLLAHLVRLTELAKGEVFDGLRMEKNRIGDSDQSRSAAIEKQQSVLAPWQPTGVSLGENLSDFKNSCLSRMPPDGAFESADRDRLRAYAVAVGDIGTECMKTGRLTDQAAEMIDATYDQGETLKRVFDRDRVTK